MQTVYLPAFYLGICEEMEKSSRCWEGYKPAPGKEPYSEDSCIPVKKKPTDKLKKQAFLFSDFSPIATIKQENLLPTINKQTKWRYVKTKDGIKLTDGNNVYTFGVPEKYPEQDSKIPRLEDDNILDFENNSIEKGTAQIHRSSPKSIYVTLANGKLNPTFILSHERDKNWRYTPSKKFIEKLKTIESKMPKDSPKEMQVDPKSLIQAAKDIAKK
jgi:hypothetical protein